MLDADTGAEPDGFTGNQLLALALDDPQARAALMERLRREPVLGFDSLDTAPGAAGAGRGHRRAYIAAGAQLLLDSERLGNAPYADVGGAFMLALDPAGGSTGAGDGDEHARQRRYAVGLLAPSMPLLRPLAQAAVHQAAVAGLQQERFDLAALSEQMALRFCGLWFGFAAQDLPLLQAAAAAGYRALVHQIVGRHFTFDPLVVEQSRRSSALLARRAAELIGGYFRWHRQPPTDAGAAARAWPRGVVPPGQGGVPAEHVPLLLRMAREPGDFNTRELASIAAGLVLGTVGNVQASVCLLMRQFLDGTDGELEIAIRDAAVPGRDPKLLQELVARQLALTPPVPFVPRRARQPVRIGNQDIEQDAEVLVWLGAAAQQAAGVHAQLGFGGVAVATAAGTGTGAQPSSPHACLGELPGLTLVTEAVRRLVRLPGLSEDAEAVPEGSPALRQRWGFACEAYPLRHDRLQRVVQQPLNLIMKVRQPLEEHVRAIQAILTVGAPRIEQVLQESGLVHFAWFEFLDDGRLLALRTVYDLDFDAYVKHFADRVGDLFDQLFEHLEDAPPLPVSAHWQAFAAVVRAHDRKPATGYFFSAYPQALVGDITAKFPLQP